LSLCHQIVDLDSGRESTPSSHDASFQKGHLCDLDIPKASTLEPNKKDSANEHEDISFKLTQKSCSLKESPESVSLSTMCSCKDHNHLSPLSRKMFRRLVVDAFVYHKHCKFYECTVVLTMQLER
jgi:hypothetical protein